MIHPMAEKVLHISYAVCLGMNPVVDKDYGASGYSDSRCRLRRDFKALAVGEDTFCAGNIELVSKFCIVLLFYATALLIDSLRDRMNLGFLT